MATVVVSFGVVVAGGACSSGSRGGGASSAVTLAPAGSEASGGPGTVTLVAPSTMPARVDAGTAALLLGGQLLRFAVTGCALRPAVDANGVTVALSVTGDDGKGGVLGLTRTQSPSGPSVRPTTTDTVTYSAGGGLVLAQRFESGGTFRDVRDPAASTALLAVDGLTIRATGTFGRQGSIAGAADLVHGDVLATCATDTSVPSSS